MGVGDILKTVFLREINNLGNVCYRRFKEWAFFLSHSGQKKCFQRLFVKVENQAHYVLYNKTSKLVLLSVKS